VYICNWIHATKNTTNIKTNNEKLNEIIKVKTEIHSDTGEIFGRLMAQNWTWAPSVTYIPRKIWKWEYTLIYLWFWVGADIWAAEPVTRCRSGGWWQTVPGRHPWCWGLSSRLAAASPRRSGCRTCSGCACGTHSQCRRDCRCRPQARDCATTSPPTTTKTGPAKRLSPPDNRVPLNEI